MASNSEQGGSEERLDIRVEDEEQGRSDDGSVTAVSVGAPPGEEEVMEVAEVRGENQAARYLTHEGEEETFPTATELQDSAETL